MAIIPVIAQPLVQGFTSAFTRPTFKRFFTLMAGAAHADDAYPARPINVVVAFPPGVRELQRRIEVARSI